MLPKISITENRIRVELNISSRLRFISQSNFERANLDGSLLISSPEMIIIYIHKREESSTILDKI